MKLLLLVSCSLAVTKPIIALSTVPASPLYSRDPHDVRHPSLPSPDCSSDTSGLDTSFASSATIDFCKIEATVSLSHQQPIAVIYSFPNTFKQLFLSLSWDNAGMCTTKQLELSPARVAGSICRRILHSILRECMQVARSNEEY